MNNKRRKKLDKQIRKTQWLIIEVLEDELKVLKKARPKLMMMQTKMDIMIHDLERKIKALKTMMAASKMISDMAKLFKATHS